MRRAIAGYCYFALRGLVGPIAGESGFGWEGLCLALTSVSRPPASSAQSLGYIKQTETSRLSFLGPEGLASSAFCPPERSVCFVEDPEIVTVLSRGTGRGKACAPHLSGSVNSLLK